MTMVKVPQFADPAALIVIGLDTTPDPLHELYDPRAFDKPDARFVANIEELGVLIPVLVRRNEQGKFEVVDGRHRVVAARMINAGRKGKKKITVPIEEKQIDGVVAAGAVISTNEIRVDDDVLAKSEKAARYYQMVGGPDSKSSLEKTANVFGVTEQSIRNYLALHACEPEVRAAVKKGILGASSAIKLAKLAREAQLELLAELTAETTTTGKPKKASARKAAAKIDAKTKQQPAHEAPSRKLLKKLLTVQGIDKNLFNTIAWVLGERGPATVPGLKEAFKTLAANVKQADEEKEAA